MRGIAAFSVVLLHTYLYTGLEGQAHEELPSALRIFPVVGAFGVPTFIVLAGFVLTLPIARRDDLTMPRSTWEFVKRRGRRILPPYYASLVLFVGLIALVPVMGEHMGTAWDSKIPVTWDGLISHLLLIHNLYSPWALQINGPAWSIATEWQLYFALPFVILPLWRKFGRIVMLVVVTVLGFGVTALFPMTATGGLWYIALFALGALAADVCVARRHIPMLIPLTIASWIGAVAIAVLAESRSGAAGAAMFSVAAACTVGVAVALLVIQLSRTGRGAFRLLRGVLESRFLVWLGLWSYSLYLVHSPLLALGNVMFLGVDMTTEQRFLVQMLVVMPLSAGIAYVFHRLVERRFLSGHQRQLERTGTPVAHGLKNGHTIAGRTDRTS